MGDFTCSCTPVFVSPAQWPAPAPASSSWAADRRLWTVHNIAISSPSNPAGPPWQRASSTHVHVLPHRTDTPHSGSSFRSFLNCVQDKDGYELILQMLYDHYIHFILDLNIIRWSFCIQDLKFIRERLGILTNSDNKAVRFCWLFRQFANVSVHIWSRGPCDVAAETSRVLCRHRRCVQSTPATDDVHTAADLYLDRGTALRLSNISTFM